MTSVPPANSMPSGMPLLMNTAAPAMMIAHDRMIAWTRHLRKLKLVFLKICMLNAQGRRLRLRTTPQHELEQRLGHENRREQVREQAEEQRHRKPADRARPELEQ